MRRRLPRSGQRLAGWLAAALLLGGAHAFPSTARAQGCPLQYEFASEAFSEFLDFGAAGRLHDAAITSETRLTLDVVACENPGRPCGVCTLAGPVLNAGAGSGTLDTRRCTNNTARSCTSDADCGKRCLGGTQDGQVCAASAECPGGGAVPAGTCAAAARCAYHLTIPTPMNNGSGYRMCVLNEFRKEVAGTVNVETGAFAGTLDLDQILHLGGPGFDEQCPPCDEPDTGSNLNDGLRNGVCVSGARTGLPCDAQGRFAALQEGLPFGSLDCPPALSTRLTQFPVTIPLATTTVTRTHSAASVACTAAGFTLFKCFCDTCDDVLATPCSTDQDCVSLDFVAPDQTLSTSQVEVAACPNADAALCLDDPPLVPDGQWVEASDNSAPTSVRLGFRTPITVPVGTQLLRARVRKSTSHQTTAPLFHFTLHGGASPLASAPVAISTNDASGTLATFAWDAALLAGGSGADVEVTLHGTVQGSGGARRTVEFGAVEWILGTGASACGAPRCLGDAMAGAPCTVASDCGSGGFCGVPGEPTKFNFCNDATCTLPAAGEGECAAGPFVQHCALEIERPCFQHSDCPSAGDSCTWSVLACYLDNGLLGGSVAVAGGTAPPVADAAAATLAGLYCLGDSAWPRSTPKTGQ